ncbi:MAG: helix-turn-helix domain-containing protein, partial [Candidatus Neomarinimicrobiota bacterium]
NSDASHHQSYSKDIADLHDIAEPIEKEETVLKSLKELEIEAIQKTLKHTDNNMSKASKILGISRMTLYRKIDSYGLNSDEQ